ncbi:MAG: 16S rRNA (guanine(966)-N(2))-methyltransferase RsmD [Deltaproteobacteria bacterium]|nr:16S rRNA (guanine(966)-N(2))-methyltransferase RsmD [Candidatus Tharpella aukensis]
MRITGGIFKGKKVTPFKNPAVRPSKAMLREALFSILGPGYCTGKVIGDFFSGSGVMALEALSRGAQVVYCIDSDIKSCDLIRSNFNLLNSSCRDTLFHLSAEQALSHFSTAGIIFDLIYLDPPYVSPELGIVAIDKACVSGCLAPNAVVVLEHQPKTALPQSREMSIWKQKKYGHSMLTFYEHQS